MCDRLQDDGLTADVRTTRAIADGPLASVADHTRQDSTEISGWWRNNTFKDVQLQRRVSSVRGRCLREQLLGLSPKHTFGKTTEIERVTDALVGRHRIAHHLGSRPRKLTAAPTKLRRRPALGSNRSSGCEALSRSRQSPRSRASECTGSCRDLPDVRPKKRRNSRRKAGAGHF